MIDIIASIYTLFWYVIVSVIVFTIALLLVRYIMNSVDVNPFTWHAMTVRNLSDPFINPVKRGISSFRIPFKYAPLIAILLVILVGVVALQLVTGTFNIVACILLAANARDGKARDRLSALRNALALRADDFFANNIFVDRAIIWESIDAVFDQSDGSIA